MDWHIERLGSCTSTQDEAKARARAGAPDGTVVVAEEMTAGRGTNQRSWAAPKGGLYLSFVVRDLADPQLLTLALGNAVADALEVAGAEAQLKWVNDVLVGGRKIAGILVEGESTGNRIDFLVCGIGINVNGTTAALPAPLAQTATTLEEVLHCDSCIPDLEAVVLGAVGNWVDRLRSGRTQDVVDAFRARDALLGKSVQVQSGTLQHVGRAAGVDDKGRLRIETSAGIRVADHGTVSVTP